PDRPDAVGRLQVLVDLDPAPADRDPKLLEPEPFGVRPATRRDEQGLCFERLSACERGADPRLDPLDVGAELDLDPLLAEGLREQVARPRADAGEARV